MTYKFQLGPLPAILPAESRVIRRHAKSPDLSPHSRFSADGVFLGVVALFLLLAGGIGGGGVRLVDPFYPSPVRLAGGDVHRSKAIGAVADRGLAVRLFQAAIPDGVGESDDDPHAAARTSFTMEWPAERGAHIRRLIVPGRFIRMRPYQPTGPPGENQVVPAALYLWPV